jgi:hypothetical protein
MVVTQEKRKKDMKQFFIYTVANNQMICRVYAENWVDARIEAAASMGYTFKEVFATEQPLPSVR